MESAAKIKEILQAASMEKLPEFIAEYENDPRSGVQKLVSSAQKKIDALEKERQRIENLKKYEKEYAQYTYICGIDEVGRGPLAGPVVAGAVILPKDCDILYINDSKQLSEKKREELYDVITKEAVAWAVGYASPERIDEINILQATYEAMREAAGNREQHTGKNIDVVTVGSPGPLQCCSQIIIEQQHNDRKNIQAVRRNDHPGHQTPDLPVQYPVRIQCQKSQQIISGRAAHQFDHIARHITHDQYHGQVMDRIFSKLFFEFAHKTMSP